MEKIENMINIKDNTKKVYLGIMKRLIKEGYKPEQKQFQKINKIKNFIESKFEKPTTRLDMLNVILITTDEEKLKEQIKTYRQSLQKDKTEKNIKVMNEKGLSLPSKEEFEKKLNDLYENEQYKAFVVNYLMFNFGVRNADVNVIIKNKNKGKLIMNIERNYLLVKPTEVEYVRNNYKTFKTYGKQKHFITDEKFLKAVNEIGEGDILDQEQQIGNQLRKILIFRMSETDIFKMLIDDAYKSRDTQKINELSISRGSSIGTISENYNVNATEQIIREL